jgi:hypothetical protein
MLSKYRSNWRVGMQRKKQPDTVYKLDSEDYENIYFRLQQRIWRVVLGMFGATSIIAFITFFSVIDSNAEKQIKKTVESKDFSTDPNIHVNE